MRSNPGGLVAQEDVVGRDALIAQLWRVLYGERPEEGQSVVLLAERRMGKSTVIRKMAAEPPPGIRMLVRDVSGLNSTLEFVGRLMSDTAPHFGAGGQAAKWLGDLWGRVGGTEVAGIVKLPPAAMPHWKELLERVFEQLGSVRGLRFVLVWDEFPLMLQNIVGTEGLDQARALLNLLRALRQTYPQGPRMLYTGSIGLHHVITELREDGRYANSPVNDMKPEDVPPLAPADATALAAALFAGEGLALGDDHGAAAAARLAVAVDGIAFYVHQVAHAMARRGLPATPESVDLVIDEALVDAQDAWDLRNFRTRLKPYYGSAEPVAAAVLDELAAAGPLDTAALLARLQLLLATRDDALSRRIAAGERGALGDLLALLMKDHYLQRDKAGAYRFRFDVLRRWWQLQ